MTLPNLVGCGAGKSGTTSLYYYLSEHPDIFMASVKETHFFSQHYEQGVDWYQGQFSGCKNERIIGEFSTSYLMDKSVPERIHTVLPQAKLLFILRNPIERAYSNYWFSLSLGTQVGGSSFSDVIHSEEGYKKYIVPGFYYDHLLEFLKYFDQSQIFIMFTENLKRQPLNEIQRCYEFLGVDPSFQPDIYSVFNRTVVASKNYRKKIDSNWLSIKASLKPFFLWIPNDIRKAFSKVEQLFRNSFLGDEKPVIADVEKAYLRNLYQGTNRQLAELLDCDLPWD